VVEISRYFRGNAATGGNCAFSNAFPISAECSVKNVFASFTRTP
jgi:hypothetical protein